MQTVSNPAADLLAAHSRLLGRIDVIAENPTGLPAEQVLGRVRALLAEQLDTSGTTDDRLATPAGGPLPAGVFGWHATGRQR